MKKSKKEQDLSLKNINALIKLMADPVLLVDFDTKNIIDFNESFLKLFGYSSKQLLNMSVKKLHSEDEFEETWKIINKVPSEETAHINFGISNKDNIRIPVTVSLSVISIDGKKYVLEIIRDVRKLHEIETEFMMSEHKHSLMFENMPNGFAYHKIVKDKKGKPIDYTYINVNKNFEKMTGLKRKNLIGNKVTKILPGIKKDTFDWIGTFGQIALGGESQKFESFTEAIGKWYSISAYSPLKDYFVVIIEDITERKKIEEELHKNEKKMKSLLDNMIDVVYMLDLKSKVISVNRAVEKVFKYKPEEVIGKNFFAWIPKEEYIHAFKVYNEIILKKNEAQMITKLRDKDGIVHTVEVNTSPVVEKGKLVGIQGVIRDISEKFKREEEEKLKFAELESFNKLMVNRELKMIELKNRIKKLENKLGAEK